MQRTVASTANESTKVKFLAETLVKDTMADIEKINKQSSLNMFLKDIKGGFWFSGKLCSGFVIVKRVEVDMPGRQRKIGTCSKLNHSMACCVMPSLPKA